MVCYVYAPGTHHTPHTVCTASCDNWKYYIIYDFPVRVYRNCITFCASSPLHTFPRLHSIHLRHMAYVLRPVCVRRVHVSAHVHRTARPVLFNYVASTTRYRATQTHTDTNNSLGIKLNIAPSLRHHFHPLTHTHMSICVLSLTRLFDATIYSERKLKIPVRLDIRQRYAANQAFYLCECTEIDSEFRVLVAHATTMWHQVKHLHKLAACIIIERYKILIGNGNLLLYRIASPRRTT